MLVALNAAISNAMVSSALIKMNRENALRVFFVLSRSNGSKIKHTNYKSTKNQPKNLPQKLCIYVDGGMFGLVCGCLFSDVCEK